ncbi:hypothetical protein CR203_22675 [Salipaludibacillus neizhouensis]|uniref:Uncharacterized protein n=1 Tax=Salipaludibacillus neizhouensis TaxID=885475 RepID=A0A3A9KCH2_9BACI|nr:hypothetical protein [Salipaludibacillus neizhouensis]RKL65075.1 hypothetical protein CR203_22675 [Salipaludibacillus neizhouensis]
MKKFIVKVATLSLLLVGIYAAPAFAESYNFQGTYSNLIYSNSNFNVDGYSSIDGYQNSDDAADTKARYSMVSKGSEPANDTVISYFTETGTGDFNRTFRSFDSYAYLRMDNLNDSGWFGKEAITSSGTYNY